jgi:hypothetical protein
MPELFWLKILYTLFLCVLIPVYWIHGSCCPLRTF